MGVGDGDGEGVGGIGAGDLRARQQALDHGVDLRFFGAASADDGLLDQSRGIFADRDSSASGRGENDAACLAEFQRRLRVLVDEDFLDRRGVGLVLVDQGFELARKIGEAFRERVGGLRFQLAIGHVRQAITLGADQAPAGGPKPRIEAEDEAQATLPLAGGTIKPASPARRRGR